jgi:hypothetical protein
MADFKTMWDERQKRKSGGNTRNGNNTNGSDSAFLSMWNERKQRSGNADSALASYFADVQAYQSRAKKDEARLNFNNANSIQRTNDSAVQDLLARGEKLRSRFGNNADLSGLDDVEAFLAASKDYFAQANNSYSNFGSQEEYDTAVRESNWYNTYGGKTTDELLAALGNLENDSDEYKWVAGLYNYQDEQEKLGYDLDAGQKKIDELKADLSRFQEVNSFYQQYVQNGGDPNAISDALPWAAEYKQLASKYGSYGDLQRSITAEEVKYNQAKRAQKAQEMAGVSVEGSSNYDPQFAQKSAYKSTELDTAWQKMWSEGGAGYGDATYEFINNTNGVREKIRDTGSKEKWRLLEKMTPEEVAVYNYHYATGGKAEAEKYIDSIVESLSARRAVDIYAPIEGKTGRELLFGVGAGLDQFSTGMSSAFSGADYIPTNSMQYASSMVREDLADNRLIKDSKAKNSLGQVAYDTITTTANMAPSIAASLIHPTLGTTLMGVSAGGNAYQEKLNAGYSKEDARAYASLVGASEALLERVLGGITQLGGGNITAALSGLDNALGRFAQTAGGKILANAGSEALEEFTQSVIEPYLWSAVSGEQTSVDWEEALYSAMLGFATGGLFESGSQATNAVNDAMIGRSVLNTKDGLANLNAAADSVSPTATPAVQSQIARAQEKAAKGGARAAGQLYNTVSAEVTKADTADIVKSLNRKGIKGDAATQIADLIVNKLSANGLTSYGEKLFNEAMRDKRVQTVVSDLIDNKMSTVGQRNQKLAAATGKEASTIDVAKVKERQRTEFVEENNEYNVAADQQTINTKTGAAVKVDDIAEITDKGVVNVQLDDGSVVNAADLSYATEDIALAYSALKGKPMSAENANRLFKMSEGMDAAEFYEAVEDGYERGYANLAKPEGEVAAAAYEAGSAQRTAEGGKETKKTRKSGINRIGRDGSISVISADEDVSDKGFSKRQLPAVQTIQALEKLYLGTAFFVVESYKIKVNGKTHIVFTDENGQVKDAPNGMYYKDGRVYIDINAGRGATGKFVLQTAAHELAHHIQQWNPSKYKVLADFLAAEYGKQGVDTYSAIKAKQQELSQIRGRSVSFNEAYHEWVADNLSVMFNDGNLYDKLVKLKHKDSALFNEIRKFIDELAKRVRKAFGMDGAETAEGKFVLSWDPRVIDRLQQIYAEALVESSERYAQAAYVENQAAEVQESTKNDGKYMEAAIRMNAGKGFVQAKVLEQAAKVRSKIAETMKRLEMDKRVALPEDVEGNTAIANSSYDVTEENTTICPRSLASEAFVDAVSEMLGRPLTVAEQLHISQDLQGRTLTPECLYCYVATDRKAYRAFLGSYVQQRDAVIKAYKDGNTDTSRDGSLYQQFLDGRKDTSNMWKRFNLWINTYKSGKPMVQASHLANISKLMGDINAEFGADLKAQIKDAMAYAQSASWAKKRISYVAYNGHILRWKQDRINKLNSHYGLRMYSFSDFSPAFILENMQMITDAAVRGLKVLGYTKEIDFVKVFAKTGMNINVSTFGFEAGGNVYENNIIGANWAEAQKLREQHPNVGITFVATNDTLVEWALAQDWIDVVIPYHLVRTGAEVAAALNYKNYTSESSDVKDIGWKKGVDEKYIAPTVHNNDFDTYMEALKKNHLKPRFERFIDNPNYMKLVNETRQSAAESKPVQPVFDYTAATESLAKLETDGYYKPIGDTVERMYEIAAEFANKLEPEPVELADVQYSTRRFADQVDAVKNNTHDPNNHVYVGTTPIGLVNILGIPRLPVLITTNHVYSMAVSEQQAHTENRFKRRVNYHDLGWDIVKSLPDYMNTPVMIIKSTTDPSDSTFVVVTAKTNSDGVPIFVAVKPIGKGNYYNLEIPSNFMLSGYGKDGFRQYVATAKTENRILYANKRNSQKIKNTTSVQFADNILLSDYSNNLARFKSLVKSQFAGTIFENDGLPQLSDRLTEPSTTPTDITEEMRQRGEKAIATATAQREAKVAAEQKTHRAIRAALTNRDLIAQIEGKTELEKRKLKEYNDALTRSREFAATVTDLNRQIKEAEESNDPKKAETIKKLTFALNKAKTNKKTMESKLSRMENQELEPLVARERVRIIEELRKEYGTIPAGENPIRDDSLPTSTDGENFVSRTARTVKGAGVTPDDFADLIDTEVAKGGLTYIRITNDEATQRAVEKITKNGWEQARAEWSAAIKAGKASAEMSAMGALLLNNAANAGDKKAWLDILHDYQQMGTNAAQAVQAMRILKSLTPSDKLYMAEKSLDALVDNLKTKGKVKLNEDLKRKYINAKTDAERDAIMGEIQQDIANQIPPTLKDKWTALRYLNMLGNLRTQARNIFGNTSMGLTVRLKDLVATGIEQLAYIATKGNFERTKALLPGKELRKAASADYDFVADIIATGGKFNDANNANSAFIRGVMEKRKIFNRKLFAGLEAYRKGTNWAMDKGDVLFSRAAYASALAGYLKAHGVTETDFDKIDKAMLDKARLYAVQEAQEATFHDINAVSEFVTRRYRGENKAGKALSLALEGIMPFRKTPANIVVRAWEYSPLGITNALVMSAKAFAKDSDVTGAQIVNVWSKALTGSGLFVAGLLLASSGHLIGGPDDDEAEDKFQQLNGEQNYALKIGNKYITIDWASPSAIPLFMGAQLYQLTQENGFQLRDLEAALTSIADPLVEMSMLQGINDTIDNIKYSDNKLMQLAINAIVGYFTQGLTNTMLGQIERSFEKSRSTTYVDKNKDLPDWLQRTLGKVSAKVPVLWDYNQIAYINAWGEEEENPGILRSLVYNMLSPSYITEDKTDAVSTELQRLEGVNTTSRTVYPSAPGKKFTFTDKDGVVHKDYQLSADEYVALAKNKGQTQRKLVENMIASQLYKDLPDLYKAKAIQAVYTYAHESAQIEVLNRDGFSSKWMGEIKGDVATGILEHIYEENAKDMYIAGDISVGDAVGILAKHSGLESTEASEKVVYWDFQEDYPQYSDLSQAAVTNYYEYAKPSGIQVSVYYDYCTKVKGKSKKADKMSVINSLPITAKQKDALYFSNGWAESTIDEAPWH